MSQAHELKAKKSATPIDGGVSVQMLRIGFEPQSLIAPRPDLNGVRLRKPGDTAVYLVDKGYRRHIPDPETYNLLFRTWDDIHEDINIDDIPVGIAIPSGAILASPLGSKSIYWVEAGVKRHISSPEKMDKYWFNWDKVFTVMPILITDIPDGDMI